MDRATAGRVEELLRHVTKELDDSIGIVMEASPPDEFQSYRRLAGDLMGAIFLDILQPIYREHPDLTPPELRSEDNSGTCPG